MDYFLSVLGMVFIIEALPYIAFPSRVKDCARYIETMPERTLQIIGIILAFAGLAVISVAKHMGGGS